MKQSRVNPQNIKDRMYVIKRSGDKENLYFDQITTRIEKFCEDLNVDPSLVSQKTIESLYSGIHTSEIDKLSAETALYMSTENPNYEKLSKRIVISNLHKNSNKDFSKVTEILYTKLNDVTEEYYNFVMENKEELDSIPNYDRDYEFTYFGYKTLEKSYLTKDIDKSIIERPQHLWMRVATFLRMPDIPKIKEVYDCLSLKYFVHASPTLFNSGKNRGQLASCFVEGTEVFTLNDGIKSIEKVKVGDEVVSHTGNVRKVVQLHKNKLNDRCVYDLKICKSKNILVTNNHKFYCVTKNDKEPKWVSVEDMNEEHYISIPSFESNQKEYEIQLDKYLSENKIEQHFEVIDNKIIGKSTHTSTHLNNNMTIDITNSHKPINNNIIIDEDMALLYGIFLGDGHVITSKNSHNEIKTKGIGFTVHNENVKLIEFIKQVMENKFNVSTCYHTSDRVNYTQLLYNSVIIGKYFFHMFGKGFDGKYLTKEIFRWNKNMIHKFLAGLITTDGCISKKKTITIQLSNKNLINQLYHLFRTHNIDVSINKVKKLPKLATVEPWMLSIPKIPDVLKSVMKTYKDDRIEECINSYYSHYKGRGSPIIVNKQKFIKFESKTLTDLKPEFVYTLGIEEDHSYNVEGLICENCFLVSMEDDLHNMLTCLRNCGMISKWAGGIGINVSMIRCNGSRIDGTGGDSNGIIPFLKLWNDLARYVNQGGKRKGAVAVYIEPHHPDILDFLKMRKNNTKDEMRCLDLHIALWISDLFMKRLKEDGDWCLFDPNKVKDLHKMYGKEYEETYIKAEKEKLWNHKMKAKDLWKEILSSQMETGEPYILFKDHINEKSNQKNRGVIRGSNLCVSKDTMILCKDGYHKISDKVNTEVEVWNGKEFSKTEVKKTGVDQQMLTVEFTNGVKICCTPYHKFYIEESKRPTETSNVKMYEAKDLKIDMKLPRNELGVCDENDKKMKYAYTHGLFCADGTYETHDTEEKRCGFKKFGDTQFCKRHQDSIIKHDDGDETCCANSYTTKPKITLYGEKQKLLKYMDYRYSNESEKTITAFLEYDLEKKFLVPINYSTNTKIRWLEGLVDGDGCLVNNNGSYGIQIASIHKEFLTDVFYMLQTLGIESTINLMRKAGKSLLPDGKGGRKHYVTKDCYRMCIKNDNIIRLKKHGFSPKRVIIPDIEYSKYNMWRYTKIKSISVNDTTEDTYCFNEPKEHKGIFNGVLLGNCSEIVQYSDSDNYAVCNLASIALPSFVETTATKRKWRVYTKENCKYCRLTYELFTENNDEVEYIEGCKTFDDLQECDRKIMNDSNHRTFPFIFMGDQSQVELSGRTAIPLGNNFEFIGGYTDLLEIYCKENFKTEFNFKKLGEITELITENMNVVIDKNYYPVEQTRLSNMEMRPTGIGVQGLADVLQMMNIPWDSPEGILLNKQIYAVIYYHSLKKSMELSKIDGPYQYFVGSPASKGILQYDMWKIDNPENVNGILDWGWLKKNISEHGLRNSLLVTQMPTASSAQILGNNESFEPYTSNMYARRVLSGDFPVINKHLYKKLKMLNLWNSEMVQNLIENNGSVQNIDNIPKSFKSLFKTVWEIPTKLMVNYAIDRGAYIDQTQSFNVFMDTPTMGKLSSMFMYSWENGIKTGMYYLRRKPKVNAIKFTILKPSDRTQNTESEEENDVCLSCSA